MTPTPALLACSWRILLRSLLRLGALGGGTVDVVLRNPALVVALGGASGDPSRLGAREGFGNLDGLLGLLGGSGSATGLGEEGLDPGLVNKVKSAAENASQEEVEEDAAVYLSVTYATALSMVWGVHGCLQRTSEGQRCWWGARRCWPDRCEPRPGRRDPWRWQGRRAG